VRLPETDGADDAANRTSEGLPQHLGLVSVIICNHNYAAFLAQAIESALGLDWPSLEVIVVDDGSTDDSRRIIQAFEHRVTAIYQPQSGQRAACNAGFARSRGDVVIFLDSDDLLDASLIRKLATAWRVGLSKVQFQMRIIDEHGRPTGALLPQFHEVPSSEEVRRWALHCASYPTPPGSGNAYSRRFLDKIFPLPDGDRAADSYCLSAAPYLGDVVTIAEPLVSYRVHGKNQGAMASLDARRFAFELGRARFRLRYARSVAPPGAVPDSDAVLERNLGVLPHRLASLKLLPKEHPIPNDATWKVLRDLTLACFEPQGVSARTSVTLWLWAAMVAAMPTSFSHSLVLWRFVPAKRPRVLKAALNRLRILKRHEERA
jgi:glycosyltransferase involved in cell wall biosynthesis